MRNFKFLLLFLTYTQLSLLAFGQQAELSYKRLLFVDQFIPFVESNLEINRLFNFANENSFSTLILYDIPELLFSVRNGEKLLTYFISQAKQHDLKIEVVGAIPKHIELFTEYNAEQPTTNTQIDSFFFELEWWNGEIDFESWIRRLNSAFTRSGDRSVSVYIGQRADAISSEQLKRILDIPNVEKIFFTAYAPLQERTISFNKEILSRVETLFQNGQTYDITIIFSQEPQFFNGAMNLSELENRYFQELEEENLLSVRSHISGYAYFAYSFF